MWSPFFDEPERRRKRDRILTAVFLVLSIVMVERAATNRRGVLLINQQLGARFIERQDLYFDEERGHRIHTPYPPSYALVCTPLSLMPPPVARRVWCLSQLAAPAVLYRVLRRQLREHWPELAPHALVLFALALLLTSRYVLRDMKGGGGNTIYVTLAVLGVDLALRSKPWRAGLALGLGLVIKPTYVLLLLMLALRKRWQAAFAAGALALALFWVPALYYGAHAYAEISGEWVRGVVQYAGLTDLHDSTLVPEGFPPAFKAMNQSLRESVHRLVRPPGDSEAFDVHFVTLSAQAAIRLAQLLSFTLVALLSYRTWRARGPRAEWMAAMTFLPLGLLVSPITWKGHHASLVPFAALLVVSARAPDRPRWLVPLLVIYYFTCNLASVEVLGDSAGDYLQAISIVAWFDVAFVLVGAILIQRESRAHPYEDGLRK